MCTSVTISTDSSYVTSGEDIHVYICHNIYGQLICKNVAAAVGTVSECTNTTTPTNVPSTRSGQLKNKQQNRHFGAWHYSIWSNKASFARKRLGLILSHAFLHRSSEHLFVATKL